ncbi:MAG: erythromycin biosynthesis sensory transduction protein eryC1, partial [Nitrospira sp.]|nr:erythromycin biosynthesis sensory transduction protein eryC1 [Nitrospira sp.]
MSRITIPFGNLKRHYERYKCEIDEAVYRVLTGGWYLLGYELECFEKRFAEYCGAGYGIGVASGTDAIEIALWACGIGQGDEVVTVSNTCVPTITGIEAAGAKPIFVDIDPATYTMNPSLIEKRINERCKAIVV